MASSSKIKEPSDLQKECEHIKRALYQKLAKYMIVGFILLSIADIIRTIYFQKITILLQSLVQVIFGVFFYKFLFNLKQNRESIITLFIIALYLISLYVHYYVDTGYFGHSSDTFYLAYTNALFERVITNRIPSAIHKTAFTVSTALIRLLIISPNDKGLLIISFGSIVSTIYFDFDQEKHDQALFGSYFSSKEQLGKFKDLVEHSIPDQIIIVSKGLNQCLFVNKAFKNLIQTNDTSNIQSHLNLFQLRESSPASERLKNPISNDPAIKNETLLDLLESRNGGQESTSETSYHFTLTNRAVGSDCPLQGASHDEKIFETKILNIEWDESPATAIVFHDITQQQTILQLKIAADANKDKVIATVSHELRTPLNGILGMIQIMFKRIQDQEILQYLKICRNSANLLLGLVNSILDLNQIRANRLKLCHEAINVQELLKDILHLFEFQCVQKNISLQLQISPKVPKVIVSDKNRLGQIFINLIGNALKFTKQGSITIMVEELSQSDMVKFSVKDTGMGIKEEDKCKLFQMYGRLDQENSQINSQGVGLGLTISNTLAQLLCQDEKLGRIKVESEYGKGSTFSFMIKKNLNDNPISSGKCKGNETWTSMSLSMSIEHQSLDAKVKNYHTKPIRKVEKLSPVHSSTEIPQTTTRDAFSKGNFSCFQPNLPNFRSDSSLQPLASLRDGIPTILIVDDNPFNITVATHLVSSRGFHVKSALYGSTAIEMVLSNDNKAYPIRLILMDCQMPVMDGYETTKGLRELMREGKIPEIPIVALTANNSANDKEACKQAGMCDYLTKPLTEANLLKVLKRYS